MTLEDVKKYADHTLMHLDSYNRIPYFISGSTGEKSVVVWISDLCIYIRGLAEQVKNLPDQKPLSPWMDLSVKQPIVSGRYLVKHERPNRRTDPQVAFYNITDNSFEPLIGIMPILPTHWMVIPQ